MVNVNNEYSKLKEIIVGRVDNANQPAHGTDLHAINYADKDKIPPKERFYFHDDVYRETEEDLNHLVEVLEDFGVKVHRPKTIKTDSIVSNGIGILINIILFVREIL